MSSDIPPDQVAPIDGTDEARARAAAARQAAAREAKRKHEEVEVQEPSGLIKKKAKKAVVRTKTSTHTVAVPEGYQPDEQQRDEAVYGGWGVGSST